MDIFETDDYTEFIAHYGVKYRSGRYEYGSGENPYQHDLDFIGRYKGLKAQGLSSGEIAKAMGIVNPRTGQPSSGRLRAQYGVALSNIKSYQYAKAKDLRDKGFTLQEIAKKMELPGESSVRNILNIDSKARNQMAQETANFFKQQIAEKGAIDIGAGVDKDINVPRERMNQAIYILEQEGYSVQGGRYAQATNPQQKTTMKALVPPGAPKDLIFHPEQIHSIVDYVSQDGGNTFHTTVAPASFDSKRLQIKYREDGGADMDGVIEVRRNKEDVSLGDSQYSQVRILVDGNKYLKGMAVYADDLPEGVDIRFNSSKSREKGIEGSLKAVKDDPKNPFGALIPPAGQSYYTDENGNQKLRVINKTRWEGQWDEWGDKLPSQFLSKQRQQLIDKQLKLSEANRAAELEEITKLENPAVKRKLLMQFAETCDKNAVNLYAAALPGQRYQVLLPVNSLSDKECFAPNYKDGTQIALVRFPHGGTFEIPILTVNNKNAEGRKRIGATAADAVGINKHNAEILSGADFDGDTVMCIPITNDVKITNSKPLAGLKDFDNKFEYPYRKGMKLMKSEDGKVDYTQKEMGMISNLITDMTLKDASTAEIEKAVKHSMVVIDAAKHKLNYMQSYADNDIATLKRKYQGHIGPDGRYHEGASTLISGAKSQVSVPARQGAPKIADDGSIYYTPADNLYYPVRKKNKANNTIELRTETGKKVVYNPADPVETAKLAPVKYVKEDGSIGYMSGDGTYKYKTKMRMMRSTAMAETKDARTLISKEGTEQEKAYANYANSLKALANAARKEYLITKDIPVNKEAKEKYSQEVKELIAQVNRAEKNAPRERMAQLHVAKELAKSLESYEDIHGAEMSKKDQGKLRQRLLEEGRAKYGAKREPVTINDRQWEAIQSGAINKTTLKKIVEYSDLDTLKERAMPRERRGLSTTQVSAIKAMRNSGYTTEQIADRFGVSTSTISNYLLGKEK